MAATKDLGSANFGFADAYTELRQARNLVRDGFYDIADVETEILQSHRWLLLGYKGAGKSMLAARMETLSYDSPSVYASSRLDVDSMPLRDLRGLIPDGHDAANRFRQAWTLHLLVQLVEQMAEDGRAEVRTREIAQEARRALRDNNIVPSNIKALARLRTARITHRVNLAKFYERTHELEPNSERQSVMIWLAYLESVLEQFRSSRKLTLFLDGLDDLTVLRDGRSALVGAIFPAVQRLNELAEEGRSVKVIVNCRTDLFPRLPIPRAGKISRDYSVRLNWYQDPREVANTHLIQLANQRLGLTFSGSNLLRNFLPDKIHGIPTYNFLLQQTKHTPRDFLQLLNIVGSHSDGFRVSETAVLAALAEYSKTYFVDEELEDALRVYYDDNERSKIIALLGTLRRREFKLEDLRDTASTQTRYKSLDVDGVIDMLFDTGFVGNSTEGGPTGRHTDPYVRFKFRTPHATLSREEPILLHYGLWKALNVA